MDTSADRFYAAGVAFALEHMHDRRIVYRDVKPEMLGPAMLFLRLHALAEMALRKTRIVGKFWAFPRAGRRFRVCSMFEVWPMWRTDYYHLLSICWRCGLEHASTATNCVRNILLDHNGQVKLSVTWQINE